MRRCCSRRWRGAFDVPVEIHILGFPLKLAQVGEECTVMPGHVEAHARHERFTWPGCRVDARAQLFARVIDVKKCVERVDE